MVLVVRRPQKKVNTASKAKKEALKTKKAALKETKVVAEDKKTGKKKIRTRVQFRRPHTLRLKRKPKYEKKIKPQLAKKDIYSTIKNPITSECAMKKIEEQNTLTFLVDNFANKKTVSSAVKTLHNVKIHKVNIQNDHNGKKVAFVRLEKGSDAVDVANKMGII